MAASCGNTVAPSIQGDSAGLESISTPTVSSVGMAPWRVQEFLNRHESVVTVDSDVMLALVGLVELPWTPASGIYEGMICLLCVWRGYAQVYLSIYYFLFMSSIVFSVVWGMRISNAGFIFCAKEKKKSFSAQDPF